MIHELKTWDEFMHDIRVGKKNFEVRKKDRDFEPGDTLILKGWYNNLQKYSGEEITAEVMYVLNGGRFGIEPGTCVMALKVIDYNF